MQKGGSVYDDELCPSCTESLTSGVGEVIKWGAMAVVAAVGTAIAGTIIDKKIRGHRVFNPFAI